MRKKTKQKSKWAKPRAASRAQMEKRDAIERARVKGMELGLLCLMRSGFVPGRLTPTTELAALRRYERHSLLTDDIFQFKLELTKVGKQDVRAHPWWKNDEGLKLRRSICNLNKRIMDLQK
jgi:hypothetical protein